MMLREGNKGQRAAERANFWATSAKLSKLAEGSCPFRNRKVLETVANLTVGLGRCCSCHCDYRTVTVTVTVSGSKSLSHAPLPPRPHLNRGTATAAKPALRLIGCRGIASIFIWKSFEHTLLPSAYFMSSQAAASGEGFAACCQQCLGGIWQKIYYRAPILKPLNV